MQTNADVQAQPSDRPQQEAHEEEANHSQRSRGSGDGGLSEEDADGSDELDEEQLKEAVRATPAVLVILSPGLMSD